MHLAEPGPNEPFKYKDSLPNLSSLSLSLSLSHSLSLSLSGVVCPYRHVHIHSSYENIFYLYTFLHPPGVPFE